MLNFLLEWINAHVALAAVMSGSLLVLTASAIVSALDQSVRIYLGALSMIAGGGALLKLLQEEGARELWFALCICGVFGGGTYFIAYLVALFVRAKRKKRARKEERYRQLQYTLPDRENTYIRARLNGALHCEREEGKVEKSAWKTEFSYARDLLAGLRAAELSATDRLQTEDLSRLLALYGKKEKLDSEDLPLVNDCFAALLKLAAKYAVNP